jgi:hypothetical protein
MLIHSVLWFAYHLLPFHLLYVRQDEITLSPPWQTEVKLSGGEWLNSRSCPVTLHEITRFTPWVGDEGPWTGLDHLERRNISCSLWNRTPGRPLAAQSRYRPSTLFRILIVQHIKQKYLIFSSSDSYSSFCNFRHCQNFTSFPIWILIHILISESFKIMRMREGSPPLPLIQQTFLFHLWLFMSIYTLHKRNQIRLL